MRKLFKAVAIVVLALTASLLEPGAASAADPAADEAAFLVKLNEVRAANGAGPLTVNPALVGVARAWSAQMVAAGDISHNPSLAAQGPSNWARLGENVGYGPSVQDIHNAFVASPAHFRNMVDGGFTEVGIGVVYSGSRIFVTANFMTPQNAPVMAAAAGPAAPAAVAGAAKTRCRKVGKRTVCRKATVRKARAARR